MAENINFNDAEVTVEIFDAVLGKTTMTDFLETDETKLSFLKNRDVIATKEQLSNKQDKLIAGANINIDEENVISAELNAPGIAEFISEDEGNAIILGTDGKLFTRDSESFEVEDVVKAEFIESFTANAIGNSSLQVIFTPAIDVTREFTPVLAFEILNSAVFPTLHIRFGQIWDPRTIEVVGFCSFSNTGELTINAVGTLFAENEYIILV